MSTVAKGTRWSTKVDAMLRQVGLVKRKAWLAAGDDMTVVVSHTLTLSVENKDHRAYDLAGWVDQAVRQCPEGQIPVVVAHRNGKAEAEDGYVVMRGQDFVELLRAR
jgi:hypothetical protein